MHDEGCAGAKRALDCQTAAVPVEHMLDQRQPQPGAALRATVRYIDAVKTLCEPRQVFRGDARTVVAYRYARLRRARARLTAGDRDVDTLAGGTIFERVFDQIFERADQLVTVTTHDHGIRRSHNLNLNAAVARQRLQTVDHLPHD